MRDLQHFKDLVAQEGNFRDWAHLVEDSRNWEIRQYLERATKLWEKQETAIPVWEHPKTGGGYIIGVDPANNKESYTTQVTDN